MSDQLKRRNTDDLVNQITEELFDENLQQRFGTSLSINMTSEYQKYIKNKYKELHNEFSKINKNPNDGITVEELLEFLKQNKEHVL
jgi:hypothetical protein